jgi:hypothetical protein
MTRKLLLVAVLAVGLVAVSNASADQFTLNVDYCSNPCLGGVPANNNAGTVTLTQTDTNIVTVNVTLNNLIFHDQGLESFGFNVTGNPALTLTTGVIANNQVKITNDGGSTWTFSRPGGNTDGAGNFMYSFECASGSGHCAGSPSTFEFQVDVTGLTVAGLEILGSANVDFAANVANGSCTGMAGAGNGTAQSTPSTSHTDGTACAAAVPEPTTLALVGSGLITLGLSARRKWKARFAAA